MPKNEDKFGGLDSLIMTISFSRFPNYARAKYRYVCFKTRAHIIANCIQHQQSYIGSVLVLICQHDDYGDDVYTTCICLLKKTRCTAATDLRRPLIAISPPARRLCGYSSGHNSDRKRVKETLGPKVN